MLLQSASQLLKHTRLHDRSRCSNCRVLRHCAHGACRQLMAQQLTFSAFQIGELRYLASWSAHLATISLRLPAQQLEAVCSCVSKHPKQLRPGDRSNLEKAFRTWAFQPGLALLGQLAGA